MKRAPFLASWEGEGALPSHHVSQAIFDQAASMGELRHATQLKVRRRGG
jgi:hypothetical protein